MKIRYIILTIFIGLLCYIIYLWMAPGKYNEFATCLTENGVVMYGTDWCHSCQNQKSLFGKSFKLINYINCDRNGQECINAGVGKYPTWRINNTNYQGLQSLEKLASLTGCSLK